MYNGAPFDAPSPRPLREEVVKAIRVVDGVLFAMPIFVTVEHTVLPAAATLRHFVGKANSADPHVVKVNPSGVEVEIVNPDRITMVQHSKVAEDGVKLAHHRPDAALADVEGGIVQKNRAALLRAKSLDNIPSPHEIVPRSRGGALIGPIKGDEGDEVKVDAADDAVE